MVRIKNIILFCLFLLIVITVRPQENYQKQIDNIFEIPKEKIPSGILINRSPALLDMNGYNPENKQQDTCSLYKWMCIYYRIYASHLNLQNFKYDKNIVHKYPSGAKQKMGEIPLGILFYDYDKLKANTVKNKLLLADTVKMKVRDLSGAAGMLTEKASCFAVSAMRDTVPVGTYSFYIEPSLFISNKTTELDELSVDFDDGHGYVKVSFGQKINISYLSAGNKTLKIKAVWKSESLTAHTDLYIAGNKNLIFKAASSTNIPVPDFGPALHPYNSIDAMYGIWYRCNHDNTIHKPILIASGFDPNDNMRIGNDPDAANEGNEVYLYNVANKDGFLDMLREKGYDIIL
jgi:hypothetical protein